MKILYLMHIDWDWIKQRPHYIAEMLDNESTYEVIVLYKKYFRKRKLTKNTAELKNKPVGIIRLPFDRYYVVEKLNQIIELFYIMLYKRGADIIYVTSPVFYPVVKLIKKQKIIYDCMDDVLEFKFFAAKRKRLEKYEKKLITASSLTVFSSLYLKEVVCKRTQKQFNYEIINNAIQLPIEHTIHSAVKFTEKDKRIVTYIGTVSEWFDYDLLVDIANNNHSLRFYVFGPVETHFGINENIVFYGPQKHDSIFSIMEKSDALIMPFKLTDLILSVNPVKLYEYIYSGKPVIAILYGETLAFEKYVYLYRAGDRNSLQEVLNTLEKNNYAAKTNPDEMRRFSMNNTWDKRIEQLLQSIQQYCC